MAGIVQKEKGPGYYCVDDIVSPFDWFISIKIE